MIDHYDFFPRLFLVRESSVAGGFVISYYFGGRAYHVPIMPHVDPTSSAVTYSLDEGRTKFFDLLQLVEFYQLNKGTLNSRLTHYIVTNNSPSSISANRSESPNSCRNASDTSLDVGKWFLSRKFVLGNLWELLKYILDSRHVSQQLDHCQLQILPKNLPPKILRWIPIIIPKVLISITKQLLTLQAQVAIVHLKMNILSPQLWMLTWYLKMRTRRLMSLWRKIISNQPYGENTISNKQKIKQILKLVS